MQKWETILAWKNIKIGDVVKWKSQSNGFWKEKRGELIAIVPANVSIYDAWPEAKTIPKARQKWGGEISQNDRGIVRITKISDKKLKIRHEYYAPRLSVLKRIE